MKPARSPAGWGAAFGAVLRGWDALLVFEMVCRGFGFLVLFPFLRRLLSRLPALAGVNYLGQDNLLLLLRRPAALLLLLGVLALAGAYVYFELTALFLYAERGWRRERVSAWGLWREAATGTVGLLRPGRLPVFLLLLPLTFSAFSMLSGYLPAVRVPEFVMEAVGADRALLTLFLAAVALCHLVLFSYLFGYPALLLSGCSFAASWRESRALLRGNRLCTAGALCGNLLLFALAVAAVAAAGTPLLAAGARLLYPADARGQFQLWLLSLQGVWRVASGAFASAFLCAVIVALYHRARGEARPAGEPRRRGVRRFALRAAGVLGTLALLLLFSESEMGGRALYPAAPTTQIIAHRAGGAFAPENTAAALNRAVEDEAHMAEIDVRQLGDGTLVALHDANFRRTTGVDLDVWDADWETVRGLDAGSSFSPAFAGEPIPTLDGLLAAAKGRIGLMIELKPTGRERDLAGEVLALIDAHGMADQCMIASMDMGLLKRVKAARPEIRTAFITLLLLSEEYDLRDLDAYSVETSSLSLGLVVQAHLQGKQVYAWTANSQRTMDKILRCDADGLVTDNPLLAAYCIGAAGKNLPAEELAELFFPTTADPSPQRQEGPDSKPLSGPSSLRRAVLPQSLPRAPFTGTAFAFPQGRGRRRGRRPGAFSKPGASSSPAGAREGERPARLPDRRRSNGRRSEDSRAPPGQTGSRCRKGGRTPPAAVRPSGRRTISGGPCASPARNRTGEARPGRPPGPPASLPGGSRPA